MPNGKGITVKIGAIVQTRISSTRLPAKVLKELPYGSGITVLEQVIRRLKKSKHLNDIIVATTTDKADEEIIRLSEKENVELFKGSVDDVLERYYLAAKESNLDVVVRITSDCPCVDPEIVDFVIEEHLKMQADFSSNGLSMGIPHGLNVEILNFATLKKTHLEAKNSFEREHVCPYIYKDNPQTFKIQSIRPPKGLTAPEIRITLDTQEDYALLCLVFDYLYFKNEYFNAYDIVDLFKKKPWLKLVNKKEM